MLHPFHFPFPFPLHLPFLSFSFFLLFLSLFYLFSFLFLPPSIHLTSLHPNSTSSSCIFSHSLPLQILYICPPFFHHLFFLPTLPSSFYPLSSLSPFPFTIPLLFPPLPASPFSSIHLFLNPSTSLLPHLSPLPSSVLFQTLSSFHFLTFSFSISLPFPLPSSLLLLFFCFLSFPPPTSYILSPLLFSSLFFLYLPLFLPLISSSVLFSSSSSSHLH